MGMNPRTLRPSSSVPVFTEKGHSRLWGLTTKSTGNISGTVESSTGSYAVKWWDNTVSVYSSGDTFSKTAAGGKRAFDVYPVTQQGSPYIQYETSLLLHFDGTNGSQNFIDSSPNNLVMTSVGAAEISTSQSKFGGSGGYLDGFSYISSQQPVVPSSACTIEFWYRPLENTATGGVVSFGWIADSPFDFAPLLIYKDKTQLQLWSNAIGNQQPWAMFTLVDGIAVNQWIHVAVCISDNFLVGYIDGVEVCSSNHFTEWVNSANNFTIGADAAGGSCTEFYIDDLRIVSGSALYDGSFSVPTSPVGVVSGNAPAGRIEGFDLSDNAMTSLRAERLTLGAGVGQNQYYGYPTYASIYVPGVAKQGILSGNLLSSQALNTFYGDLRIGSGDLFVTGNPGINADDPTIATTKGYTVFGSEPSP